VSDGANQRGPIACPRCGETVAPDQDWCLNCGAAARTKIVPAPDWRKPVAVLATLLVLSLVAISVAYVDLTNDPTPPKVVPVPTVKTVTAPAPTTTTAP
jgi:hypothetical protein